MGSWTAMRRKAGEVVVVVRNTLDARERRRRLETLRRLGRIDEIPNEWQIAVASAEMFSTFILPTNAQFYEVYGRDEYWTFLLRFLDSPATLLDPSGLAITRDALVDHLMHAVHVSAAYDVALLETMPDGLDELDRQLTLWIEGAHPRQEALDGLIERADYPHRLREALRRYRQDPDNEWEVRTYEAPHAVREAFQQGFARFGTIGRFLRHAASLPPTPWSHLGWT